MPSPREIAHQLAIAARLAGRSMRRRLAGTEPPPATDAQFRAALGPWLAELPPGVVADHVFLRLSARTSSWQDTGWDLRSGEAVTVLASGRVYLSRALDIWVGPSLGLWFRVGDDQPVFRGSRDTHTFTARHPGRLWLANGFPGKWLDPHGRREAELPELGRMSGDLSALLLRWPRSTDVHALLGDCARRPATPALVLAEAERLREQVPTPAHWQQDWRIGANEIFRSAVAPDGRPALGCHTHRDVGILQRAARAALAPGTRLQWSWCVDRLPSELAEDTLPSHDYLSIAVEFDDGQDITYFWSATLPAGTTFRCPLPGWRDIETHVVVRSGRVGLGRWLQEERDLYSDYRRIVGGPAREVVRIWLIGESVMQRGHGRCEYASIRLTSNAGTFEVL